MKEKLWAFCRKLISLALNLSIIYMETIAMPISWDYGHELVFTMYTELSNMFNMAVCALVALCQLLDLFTGRELPRWVTRLKFLAACCLTMTFLTVVFVLAPYYPEEGGVFFLLTESSMLYHHLINPLCVFISFVFLEREPRLSARNIPLALVPTAVYGAIALWANVQRLWVGPYPFLMVYEQTVEQSVLWCVGILGMNLFYAWLVWFLGGNFKKRR